jgi:hypothetical protein
MTELAALDQVNWLALASLLIQVGFLVAGIWFARKVLRAMRTFQEQVSAILKLSITGVIGGRQLSSISARQSHAEASHYWIAPAQIETIDLPEPIESGPSRLAVARHKLFLWLQTPMRGAAMGPWLQISTWLRAPAGG